MRDRQELIGHLLEVLAGPVGRWSDRVGQPTGTATKAARQPAVIAPATSSRARQLGHALEDHLPVGLGEGDTAPGGGGLQGRLGEGPSWP